MHFLTKTGWPIAQKNVPQHDLEHVEISKAGPNNEGGVPKLASITVDGGGLNAKLAG